MIETTLDNNSNKRQAVLSFNEYRNRLISSALIKRGLYESVTFSFLSTKDAILYSENISPVVVQNPISEDYSVMRTSLLPNLINNFLKNNNRGLNNSGLFEVGSIYLGDKENEQIMCSAGIRSGQASAKHWGTKPREFDIYDSKKDAFNVLQSVGVNLTSITLNKDIPKWYHPGRAASINLGKTLLGYFGELHPKYTENYGMRISCFELIHNNLPQNNKKKFNKNFTSYSLMPIKRDFAFLVSIDISSEDLINSIKKSLNSITYIKLIEINLFDIYLDNLSSSELKSLAFEVIMQPTEKTLKENEISDITNLIISDAKKNTNAILRS